MLSSFRPSRAGKTNDNPNEAENNPLLFAERLTEKLNTVIAQRAKQANQTQRLTNLDINHPASVPPPRRHPASTSTSYHQHHAHHQTLDQESDQSILDDHCSRVFEESPVTSPRNERADRSAAAAGPQRGMSNTLNPRKMQQQAYGIPHRKFSSFLQRLATRFIIFFNVNRSTIRWPSIPRRVQ